MKVVLDAGALIAIDRRDRRVGAMLRLLQGRATPLVTSGGVVAQVWRDGARQANLARSLRGVDARPIDGASGRTIGELLARSDSNDIVDAHLASIARDGDRLLTSDPGDLRPLLGHRRVKVEIISI